MQTTLNDLIIVAVDAGERFSDIRLEVKTKEAWAQEEKKNTEE